MSGIEIEAFTLDKSGRVVNQADLILKEAKKINKDLPIVKECSKSMIELGSYPSVKVTNTAIDLLNTLEQVIEIAQKNNLNIYPLSVYPGKYKPQMRTKKWYNIQKNVILGREAFEMAGKTTGFHYHYTLPKGIFDLKKLSLKPLTSSKFMQSFLDSYNLGIAMDPALTTLFQSSPYFDGRYHAKDTRAMIQRTGRALPFKGIYSKAPKFGGLPIYKSTITDLIYTIDKRYEKLKSLFEKNKIDPALVSQYGSKLQFSWHTIRVNRLGTLELRTMDMNHPKYVIAGVVMLKYIFRKIQRDFLQVRPSDIGVHEPFKIEGNVMHIPPHTHVRKKLQPQSILEGLSNKEVKNYTNRFFRFARQSTPKEFHPAIKPLANILRRNKTVSDVIVSKFKRKGFGIEDHITDKAARQVALSSCRQLLKEIERTKKTVENLE